MRVLFFQLLPQKRFHTAVWMTLLLIYSQPSYCADYFDPESIEKRNGETAIDLSTLERPGGQLPGRYHVEIYLNGTYVSEKIINFIIKKGILTPDITKNELVEWGVQENATSAFMHLAGSNLASPPEKYLPESLFSYDSSQQRLDISIPQEYIKPAVQGVVPPEEWDDGMNAVFLNYAYSGASNRSDYREGSRYNNFLNLRSGMNVGAWRFRNYSTWSDSQSSGKWNSLNTYLQRDIKVLKAQVVAGESYTSSEVFDSFAFTGVQLYSDENMQPESLRGFAPVVRGIAQSNARVTIQQDGNIIYQAYVPPGPFAIADLYPTSSSGDLHISIREADGTVRQFTQAFSAVPIMLREGRFKYSLTAGKYRTTADNNISSRNPEFLQATGILGLSHAATFYGGTIISKNYQAAVFGLGKGLGEVGSVSLDSTFAKTKLVSQDSRGSSIRFQYSKDFAESGTTLTLAGYRYSTSGYLDFSEANGFYDSLPQKRTFEDMTLSELEIEQRTYTRWRFQHNKRSRAQLNINQTMGNYGSLFLSAFQQQYWGVSRKESNLAIGYNINKDSINYSFNFSWAASPYYNQTDRLMSVAVQIPLDRFLPKSQLNLSSNQAGQSGTVSSVGISGSALADNRLSYNLQQGYSSGGNENTGSASANYKARYGEYTVGYNYTRYSQQFNYSAMGGVVFHPYGITLSQPLGDTFALVRAERASGIKVENNSGIYTDGRGYAVVPYLMPYQRNSIKLNTDTLSDRVDIITDTRFKAPGQGAIVLADFPTQFGQKMMLTLDSRFSIPLGASATVTNGLHTSSGMINGRHQVYLSGIPEKGIVHVKWQGGSCNAKYAVDARRTEIQLINSHCK